MVEPLCSFLIRRSLVSMVLQLILGKGQPLTKQIIILFYLLLESGVPRKDILAVPHSLILLLKAGYSLNNQGDVWAYVHQITRRLCDYTCHSSSVPPYLRPSEVNSTSDIDIFRHGLLVRNRLWTFGSVLGSHGVQHHGKYAFEFHLGGDGVIQVGWSSGFNQFNEYGGWGIGDYPDSYAFDGSRVRKWNGRDVDQDTYGLAWHTRDIVTCLIDLDSRNISFMLNGNDMGVAFTDIDNSKIWYPAVSLTGGQWGSFLFGSALDPMKFCPTTHLSISPSTEEIDSARTVLTFENMEGVRLSPLPTYNEGAADTTLLLYYEAKVGLLGSEADM